MGKRSNRQDYWRREWLAVKTAPEVGPVPGSHLPTRKPPAWVKVERRVGTVSVYEFRF